MTRSNGEPIEADDAETRADETGISHEAVTRLQQAARRRKTNFNIANTAAYTSMAFTVAWTWWILQQTTNGVSPFSLPLTWALTCGYALTIIVTFAYTWRGAREVKTSLQAIAERNEVSAVGPLLETMEMGEPMYDLSTLGWSDRPVVGMAAQALAKLLPRLQASDAALLTPHQRIRLYKALELSALAPARGRRAWRGNADFAIAALRGLEQIGDHRAVPVVERLARNARDPQVREAAEACLPALQARAALERSNATLLRAADAATGTTTAPDILLRPAFAVNATDPTELLRAAAQEGDRSAEEETERLLEALQKPVATADTQTMYFQKPRAASLSPTPIFPQPAEEHPQSLQNRT